RFRSIEEMQLQLRTPVMAVIRRMKPREFLGPKSLQVVAEPDSPESEGFRTLRTALALSESDADTIVVSSTEPGDGKSTVAANLAAAFAQAGKKTLLIDGDLRRPGLTAMLGYRGESGLSRALQSNEDIEEAAVKTIRSTGIENLDLLPAGPRALHPAELLSGSRLAELLAWVENVYDQVVIDSPPVLAAGDTAILGRLADGVLLVVQPEKNRRRVILRAAEYLTVLKIRLVGLVVNRTAKERVPGYDAYDTAYDYHGRDESDDPVSADGVPFDDDDEDIVPRRVA
ncbi:MAG: tyrosine-protein kinase family protein, partial [Planctomycetota bacterium]